MAKGTTKAKVDINNRTDLPAEKIFIGIGRENGGGLFVQEGTKMTRLVDESPAFRHVMHTMGGARNARRAAARTRTL